MPLAFGPMRTRSASTARGWAILLTLALLALAGSAVAHAQTAAKPYVAIDPGHGDKDSGAVGILVPGTQTGLTPRVDSQGREVLYEKDVNLDIAQRLDAELRAWGARTVLTRTADLAGGDRPFTTTTADLKARTDLANELGVDLFVSIHNNAISSPAVSGTETYHYYYSSAASKRLAEAIQTELVATLRLPDRKVQQANFYVLRNTGMPAVLVEGAFLTNAGDLAILADPAGRQRIAGAVARGVRKFAAGGLPSEGTTVILPPTIGPWKTKPKSVPAGYRLVKTGRTNPVGKGGWLAVREGFTAPATERTGRIGPWRTKPKRVPDGYRIVRTGKGLWLGVPSS